MQHLQLPAISEHLSSAVTHILSLPPLTILGYAVAGAAASAAGFVFVYIPLRFLYRITLHPLAKVPGPKWMLVSGYASQVYWEATGDRQGTSLFAVQEWHKKYGPIVRTAVDVVHIDDIETYNQIFKVGTKFPKTARFYNHPSTRGSLLDIIDFHEVHLRRSALQPYFSKQAVRKLQGLIQGKVSRFLDRLVDAAHDGTPVNLTRGFRCLACDIITSYSYEQCFDAIDDPSFSPEWLLAFESLVRTQSIQTVFPWFFSVLGYALQFLPRESARVISPAVAHMVDFLDVCRAAVLKQKQRWMVGEREIVTIFEQLFQDDPKKGRKKATDDELAAEAMLTVSAGMDTTGHALTLAAYHIMKNQDVQARLLAELKTVMPTPTSPVEEETLDHLPFLQAVIKETLRFSHGVPGPLPRDVPPSGATLLGYYLPPGTATLNSNYIYHTNETAFPDPHRWHPARWLAADTREMERYWMPFSRGARVCIGMNLAMAELTITIARMVRQLEFAPAPGFKDEDMRWISQFVAVQKGFLKVTVRERVD
ncbi:hypothetical protein TWF696_008869 [Orbilia brochopaga]|uniref:Cytochrome P450 n=1 Tax=Orbilia brochopaga TaxID=3140254 RepID=A0AAV9UFW0_9PEZI